MTVQAEAGLLDNFVFMLSGEFDSQAQQAEDVRQNVPKDLAHGRVFRTFTRVDAPGVSDFVVITTTSYGVERWYFDEAEFMVWILTVDPQQSLITMSPRRFKDLEERVPFAFSPDKLGGFESQDLEPAVGGAACDILWSQSSDGFIGRSAPCRVMSVTKNKVLTWSWRFSLSADALEVTFSGSDDNGEVLDGSPAGSPYRLDRVIDSE